MRRRTLVGLPAVAAMVVSTLAGPTAQAPSSAAGERDPFTPPSAGGRRRPVSRRVQPVERRLADLTLDGVVLIGVACSTARQAAVLRSRSGRAWAVAAGDRLRDSRVARVTCDAVLFERVSPKRREGAQAARPVWRHLEGGKETR